ncbi:hypothetical protein N9M76_00080 [Gammaproteobacteria bacterium]|nr:hypothetical protein [Gammaproteobacteria bacterium]
MFGFGKRDCRKDELFMSVSRRIDEEITENQKEKMLAGSNMIGMQSGLAFRLLRNIDAASQLSDDEFKLFLIIVMQGMNDALFENIDVNDEIKSISLAFLIADGYKNFGNQFNYYLEDVLSIFEKISDISSEEWVQQVFLEGRKAWNIIAENTGDMMPIGDVFQNEELVLKVKNI